MKVYHCTQGTPEWYELRRGLPTASAFSRIITSKGKLSKQADAYAAELCAEIASLNPTFFTSRGTEAMRNGHQWEAEARDYYSMSRNVEVAQVGFCLSDCESYGMSPDGLILGSDGNYEGVLELKCAMAKTHAHYVVRGTLPTEHVAQVHGQLLVSGLPYVDYLSYSPGLEPLLIRVTPNEFTEQLRTALEGFLVRFQEIKAKLCPPTPYSLAVSAWKKWLRDCGDDVAEVNKGLPNMAPLQQDIKAECWRLAKLHADSRGWTFNPDRKQFEPAYQPAF